MFARIYPKSGPHFQIKLLTVEISLGTLAHVINRAYCTAACAWGLRTFCAFDAPMGGQLWSVAVGRLEVRPAGSFVIMVMQCSAEIGSRKLTENATRGLLTLAPRQPRQRLPLVGHQRDGQAARVGQFRGRRRAFVQLTAAEAGPVSKIQEHLISSLD